MDDNLSSLSREVREKRGNAGTSQLVLALSDCVQPFLPIASPANRSLMPVTRPSERSMKKELVAQA